MCRCAITNTDKKDDKAQALGELLCRASILNYFVHLCHFISCRVLSVTNNNMYALTLKNLDVTVSVQLSTGTSLVRALMMRDEVDRANTLLLPSTLSILLFQCQRLTYRQRLVCQCNFCDDPEEKRSSGVDIIYFPLRDFPGLPSAVWHVPDWHPIQNRGHDGHVDLEP
jgi:hypothetical protein